MSYLLWPHFHFSGTFRADISTVNNFPYNYDTETFVAANLLQNHSRSWNPRGSGEWSVTGSVTHVCYANGHCVGEDEGDQKSEPLLGEKIIGTDSLHDFHNGDFVHSTLHKNGTHFGHLEVQGKVSVLLCLYGNKVFMSPYK